MKNNKLSILAALAILVLASLACSFGGVLPGGDPADAPAVPEAPAEVATTAPEQPAEASQPEVETGFPMPDDASNIMDLGDGALNFQTGMSIEDAVAFYRNAFTAQGLTEREITTTIDDTIFSIVFDGHSSGKAIAVQGVNLGNGVLNINIRFEDI